MFKFIRNLIITLLCVCIVMSAFVFGGQLIPYQYDKSYYAVMRDKYYHNLERTTPEIIFVGGSNLTFGLDTKAISDAFGRDAYNFGFHAGLKRDFYLNAIKKNIQKGDIIVLVFEYSAYIEDPMSEDITWYTIDNCFDLFKCIPSSNMFGLLRYYPMYLFKKAGDAIKDPHPVPSDKVYAYDSFNEFGDNIYERYDNVRDAETIKKYSYIEIKKDIISEESVKAFKQFKQYCDNTGAKVYASCPSVDEVSLKYVENNGVDFKKTYEELTGIKMISEPSDYILDTCYFYDTDYHLNINGVKLRTQMLIDDLKTVL